MNYKILLLSLLFAVLNINAFGVVDTIIINNDNSAERISRDLDSLVSSWYVKTSAKESPGMLMNDSINLQFADTVYISRLSKINSIIKLPFNNIIRNHIHVYTIKQRDKFSAVLGLKDYYFPMI